MLVKSAEQRPKPSDVNAACRTLKTNMGRLIHQNRLNVLEALKVRVQTVQTARIEGVLPVVSTVQEDIELTPLRRGLRGEVTKF